MLSDITASDSKYLLGTSARSGIRLLNTYDRECAVWFTCQYYLKNNPGYIQKSKHATYSDVRRYTSFSVYLHFLVSKKYLVEIRKIDISLGIDLSPQVEKLSFKIQETK